MRPSRFLKAFVISFVLFTLLDAVWHTGIMADFYGRRLIMINTSMMGSPAFSPFILFIEAINAVALSYFVLYRSPTLTDAAWIGALLGFTVTSTLNFLNHSLIPQWDIVLALVDTAWGTVTGIVAAVAIAAFCNERKKAGMLGMMRR